MCLPAWNTLDYRKHETAESMWALFIEINREMMMIAAQVGYWQPHS